MKSAATVQIPESADLEQAVLGLCFLGAANIDAIAGCCGPDDFYHHPHHDIFAAIISLHGDKTAVTPLTVMARLANHAGLREIGGKDYLAGLALAAPAVTSSVPLARSIADLRLRRDAISAAEQTAEGLSRADVPVLDALKPTLDMADRAAEQIGKRINVPIAAAITEMLTSAEGRLNGDEMVAATTGLKKLDDAIGGLQGGDLVVYAGRPGMGKSALLMASALRTAMSGRPTLFFSLEMTQERLLQRVGCDLDYDANPLRPLSYSRFRNGKATHDDLGRIALSLRHVPDNLQIVENGALNIHEIAAMCRSLAGRSSRMGAIFIDYLQKISPSDRYRSNRVQEVTEISGACKALAMSLKWPVIVGAQLNRGVESREEKRPTLTDLRESGSIEQDADAVIGLFRPGYYVQKEQPALGSMDPGYANWRVEFNAVKHRLDLFVLKNRHGEEWSGNVHCDMGASAIRDEAPSGVT